jgi:hypothetical protein
MFVECTDKDGFEDQLTLRKQYLVKEFGENSYLIENDAGGKQWYGTNHFSHPFITE